MQEIIQDFFRGNINGNDGRLQRNPEYKMKTAEMDRLKEQLMSKLDEEGKSLFESYRQVYIERSYVEGKYIFDSAFGLGTRMMLEVMKKN